MVRGFAAEAFAETLLSADPETDDREDSTGSETDLFPSRFLLEALSSALPPAKGK